MGKGLKKLLKTTVIVLAGLMVLLFVGAGCIQDVITPCYVDQDAAEWADVPPKLFMPYSNLWDAKRLTRAIDYKLTIERIKGGYYKSITNLSILAGEELKNTVFAPDGLLSLLMIGGPCLAAGGIFIPRGKDKREIEALKNGNKS